MFQGKISHTFRLLGNPLWEVLVYDVYEPCSYGLPPNPGKSQNSSLGQVWRAPARAPEQGGTETYRNLLCLGLMLLMFIKCADPYGSTTIIYDPLEAALAQPSDCVMLCRNPNVRSYHGIHLFCPIVCATGSSAMPKRGKA